MLVFVEGSDLSGKTVLAKKLAAMFNLEYVKEYCPGELAFQISEINMRRNNAVVDRGYFSEIIYSMLDEGRACGFNTTQLWRQSLYAMRRGALFLVLWEPDDVLMSRRTERGDERPGQQILQASCLYKNIDQLWWTPMEVTVICASGFPDHLLEQVGKLAQQTQETRAAFFSVHAQGWGRLTPRGVLIVGERINPNKQNREQLPFCDHRDNSSSGYLYRMLMVAGLRPRDVFIMNALTPAGEPYSASLVAQLKPKVMVALGSKALAWCEHAISITPEVANNGGKSKLISMEHPSYLKRFWNDYAADYGGLLRKELEECWFKQ